MTPMTLRSLERGGLGVTVGAYLGVMQVLGIEKDLEYLAQDDPLGRSLQDAQLPRAGLTRSHDTAVLLGALATRQAQAIQSLSEWRKASDKPARPSKRKRENAKVRRRDDDQTNFVDSRQLADLLRAPEPRSSRAKRR
jgi:hypothetical protein